MKRTMQNQSPVKSYQTKYRVINSFVQNDENLDPRTVDSFGEEWTRFKKFSDKDIAVISRYYFDIVDDTMINKDTVMADFGCGTGRFIKYFEDKVAFIVGVDPSKAIFAADSLIGENDRVELCQASISNIPYPDGHFDFAMSIGVLHHIPDTQKAMTDCVKKVKQGGHFFTYIYYSLDNRSKTFRQIWKVSDLVRKGVSRMPSSLKHLTCDGLAVFVYMPFILATRGLKKMGVSEKVWSKVPLAPYADKSFFVIRNDALDRFGTPLEQRFSREEIKLMMERSGLTDIRFSENPGYWHAVGRKA